MLLLSNDKHRTPLTAVILLALVATTARSWWSLFYNNGAAYNSTTKGRYIKDGSLFGNIHLSSDFTNEGALKIPDGVNRIWIEIGANARDLAQNKINTEKADDVMLLTFEPLIDKYGFITSLGTKPDTRRRAGHQSANGKMLVFPFAVSETSGQASFNVADVDGCSSLLTLRGGENYKGTNPKWQGFINRCATAQESRIVPTIAFSEILDKWLQGRTVDWLKIDAQGMDVQIVQFAGKFKRQLRKVSMETTKDSCDTMYEGTFTHNINSSPKMFLQLIYLYVMCVVGALKCTDMYRIMTDLGFSSPITSCDTATWNAFNAGKKNDDGCEADEFTWYNNEYQENK